MQDKARQVYYVILVSPKLERGVSMSVLMRAIDDGSHLAVGIYSLSEVSGSS